MFYEIVNGISQGYILNDFKLLKGYRFHLVLFVA